MSYHLAAWAMDVDVPPREKLMLILIARLLMREKTTKRTAGE